MPTSTEAALDAAEAAAVLRDSVAARWAARFADAKAHPISRTRDVLPPDPRRVESVLVTVTGPISWSWYWPKASVEAILKRAVWQVKRLPTTEAPHGVYRVTVNGTSREVVRSAREDAAAT